MNVPPIYLNIVMAIILILNQNTKIQYDIQITYINIIKNFMFSPSKQHMLVSKYSMLHISGFLKA